MNSPAPPLSPRAAVRAGALALALSAAALVSPAVAGAARTAGPATAAAKPQVDVLLVYRERPALHAFVQSVTDPASPRYRRYLTVEQIAARYGAGRSARRAVAAWAAGSGLRTTQGPSGTFAIASGPAASVRAALGGSALAASAATPSVPVPAGLRGPVASATLLPGGESAGGAPRAGAAQTAAPTAPPLLIPPREAQPFLSRELGSAMLRTGTPAGCQDGTGALSPLLIGGGTQEIQLYGFTPNQYTTAYGHAELHKRGLRGEGMRIALMETDGFKRSDIETFARCFGSKMPKISQTPVGQKRMPAPGDETTLDLSVLVAAAPRLSNIDVYASAGDEVSLLKSGIAALRAGRPKPDVISISLGVCEPLLSENVATVRALSDVFAVAAGAGIGVFASTGDQGDAGCYKEAPSIIPAVAIPAALPYVTAVGGTNLTLDAQNRIVSEQVWNNAPASVSGGTGGYSIMTDRPWYQEGLGRTTSGDRGVTRVVPDVAALADVYPGYALFCTAPNTGVCQDGWSTVGGTSAAAPLTAAGALLMTQEAERNGQAPVGFLNPLLYDLAAGADRSAVLRDVTRGSNDVTPAISPTIGGGRAIGAYPARRGYDAASGWGSPKFSALSRAALRAGARSTR